MNIQRIVAGIEAASYETTSVYGFGHPLYYDNVIRALRGECEAETDGREGLRSLELLIAVLALILPYELRALDPLLAAAYADGAALAITVTYVPQYFRVVRNHVISVREESYVEAARALGAADGGKSAFGP